MFVPMGGDVILPGRSCGSCTLCCKLLRIEALDKPRDIWCRHCAVGRGVIVSELEGTLLTIQVDPARPDAWRQAPYHADIRQWAAWAAPAGHQVTVYVGRRAIVIFPDRDVDLGILAEDERILVLRRPTPAGMHLDALKVKADDPRLPPNAREVDRSDTARRTA
jgi:hypothetical protein